MLAAVFVTRRPSVASPRPTAPVARSQPPAPTSAPDVVVPLGELADLGARTAASVPTASTQVVVVRGDGPSSSMAGVELFQRSGDTWVRSARWRGRVGAKGWTDRHREGDLRTPVGTYTLSDAGGLRPNPGTALPYYRSGGFVPRGDSVFGDSLEGSFDYVLAIDYNRSPGRSPLDPQRPLGRQKGGGIWLHVDHGGPTHGCIALPEAGITALLKALRPDAHPVVVQGPAARLAT